MEPDGDHKRGEKVARQIESERACRELSIAGTEYCRQGDKRCQRHARQATGGEIALDYRGHGPESWTALSVLLYLPTQGDELVGGETFVDGEAVAADPWSVAAFSHRSWHHGAEVMAGAKVVARTDVIVHSLAGGPT